MIGILMRGEPFRWGADSQGMGAQKRVYDHIQQHVISPLRDTYNFTYLLGVDRRQNYSAFTYEKLRDYTLGTPTVFLNVNTRSQVSNFKEILGGAKPFLPTLKRLFIFRHDITVTKSILHWGCDVHADEVLFPGYVQGAKNDTINDIYHIVPKRNFGDLFQLLFTSKYPCWAMNMRGWLVSTGHFCHRVFDEVHISYGVCHKTQRVRHHSPNYTTHELSVCGTLPFKTNAWRCGTAFRQIPLL